MSHCWMNNHYNDSFFATKAPGVKKKKLEWAEQSYIVKGAKTSVAFIEIDINV
ncbi:hypothetical protein ACTAZI_00285 [Legionella bozemanae]|uniref:hypothetical protein n=1 Tax=Legionella bozemanae TaxID=447 RepID=UPI00399CF099